MSVNGVRSVETALRVLEELAAHESMGVTALSRALGLPKGSLQRMLYTLEGAGWVRRTGGELTRWTLTTRMLALGQLRQGETDLRTVVLPMMERLRDATRETVHLAVRDGDNVVIIERLESPQPVRTHVTLGMAVPMVASANGKAILSTLLDREIQDVIDRGLTSYTETTVTEPHRLWEQIEQIRSLGYATNEGEWRGDVAAVATPIVEGRRPPAGLSISTPAHRMTADLQEQYGTMLVEAAAAMVEALAGTGYR